MIRVAGEASSFFENAEAAVIPHMEAGAKRGEIEPRHDVGTLTDLIPICGGPRGEPGT